MLGVPLHILSGDEEAAASYRGAITAFGPLHGEELGVVDVGGGSTEYAIGDGADAGSNRCRARSAPCA